MKQLLYSSGTTQKDRTPEVLLPEYINVEEKTDSDYLNFIRNFSEIIQYWNIHNYAQGNFQEFFKEDLSFLLAHISTIDLNQFSLRSSATSKTFLQVAIPSEKEQALVDLLLLDLELIKLFESWYTQITKLAISNGNPREIEFMVQEIAESNLWNGSLEFEYLYKRMWMFFVQNPSKIAQRNLPSPVHFATLFFEKILDATALKDTEKQQAFFTSHNIDLGSYEGFFNYLEHLYESLFAIVSLIKQSVPSFLNQSLQIPNHSPQVTLLIAFWEMQQQSNQLLNQFTQKHLDFYYFDVLRQRKATSIPDQVLLSFQLNPAQSQNFIPKGTPFLAGASPSGKPLLYTSDSDLTVNKAKAIAFKTLYNGTIGQNQFGNTPGLIYASPIANSGNGIGGKFTKKPASWPSLGTNSTEQNSKTLAKLGFALSNPVFFLSEGKRNITIVLELSEDSVEMLKEEVAKLSFTELTYWEILELLVNESFTLKYTGPKGWVAPFEVNSWMMPLKPEGESKEETNNIELGITFFINISHTQPAVVAYNSKIHGAGFRTSAPIIQFEIAQSITVDYDNLGASTHTGDIGKKQLTVNPYSLFSKITIDNIPIFLDVKGVKDFVVQNDFSVLSSKKPYPPFGVSPLANNHFYLGNNEIFRKHLSHLSLVIDWYDLPKMANGFCDYYKDYNRFQPDKPFYNSVFKWDLDMLVSENQPLDDIWKPLPFSSKVTPLKPADIPPVNPSDPPTVDATKLQPANKTNPGKTAPPPKSLTPELAQKLLNKLSKYYGENWKANTKTINKNQSDSQLQIYKNSNIIGKPVIANLAFIPALDTINKIAVKNKVTVYVTKSFIASSLTLKNISTPLIIPNHLVGHAIDFNLIYKDSKIADADYLSKKNEHNWDPSVKGFIADINKEATLTWGGNLNPEKPNHIDDNLFNKDRPTWTKTYETVQTEWKAKPLDYKTKEKPVVNPTDPSIQEQLAEKIIDSENQTSQGDDSGKNTPTPPQALSPEIAKSMLAKLSQYLGENWKTNAKDLVKGFDPALGLAPPLTIFSGSQFLGEQLVADLDFLPALHKINELALENHVFIYVLDSFKPSSVAVADLKKPIKMPNHLVGHAFDFNLIYDNTKTADATYLKKSNEANWAPSIKGFFQDINEDKDLRWGGNLSPENPAHMDDGFYQQNQDQWKAKYTATQAAWKSDPLDGTIENNMFEWYPVKSDAPSKAKTQTGEQSNTPKTTAPNGQPPAQTPTDQHRDHGVFKDFVQTLGHHVDDADKKGSLFNKIDDLVKGKVEDKIKDAATEKGGTISKALSSVKNILGGKKTPTPAPPENDNSNQKGDKTTPDLTPLLAPKETAATPLQISCPYKNEGVLKTQTIVEVSDFKNIKKSDLTLPTSFSSKDSFTDQSVDGFLRFTLTNPPYAFGGGEYARIVAAVANYNMKLIENKILNQEKVPNDLKALKGIPANMKASIDAFLNDSNLKKLLGYLKSSKLQKRYNDAVGASATVKTLLKGNLSTASLQPIYQQFETINNFLYPIGQIISHFASLSPPHKTLAKKVYGTYKKVFGHHPLLGGLASMLGSVIPAVGTIEKVAHAAKSILGNKAVSKVINKVSTALTPLIDKEKTAVAKILKNYNLALQFNNATLSQIKTIMSDAGITPKSSKTNQENSSTGADSKSANAKATTAGTTTSPASNSKKALLPPRPAYIPKISKITASYSAIDEIDLSPTISDNNISSQFFHLDAFGISIPEVDTNELNLLPVYTEEGYLYIAVEEVSAPEIVTLLFTFNKGSGNRDAVLPKVKWSYLDNGHWLDFTDSAVKDGTNGFVQSGIISFNLLNIPKQPDVLNDASTMFIDQANANQLYWLRATAPENADAVCEIMNVFAQATTASYASGDTDPDHFAAPLPEKTISKFQHPDPNISKIVQPVASVGGKASEDDSQFYTRVNERLRHKGRALNAWDYERLILQHFPSIGLARCLNHTSHTKQINPGNVTVLILPQNIVEPGNLLSPKTDQGKIKQVKEYLQNIIDPFVKLEIRNPKYQYIQVDLKLTIATGLDPGHTLEIINQGLINQIAPWNVAYQNTNLFEVSNSYYSILEFLYSQPYVKEVFTMDLILLNTLKSKTGKLIDKSYDPIKADEPWGLISSVGQHKLSIVTEAEGAALLKGKKVKKKKNKGKKQKLKLKEANNSIEKKTDDPSQKKTATIVPDTSKVLSALYIGNNLYNKRGRKH